MNKTVNINLAGIFFHIDEDAYLKLQRYLEAIKRSFTDSQGRSEIIADIEARIAELFTERIQYDKQVIGIKQVDEVITIMGQPEDYLVDHEIFEDEPSITYKRSTRSAKKLYRDKDNSYIAGVSSGLGHYLGIDAIWVRLLWILLTIGSGGTFILVYILFWILVPEAVTTSEKLTMTGEPVNITNIEKKIKDGFDNVHQTVSDTVRNVDFEKHGNRIKSSSKTFFDTVGDIIMFFLKVFAKFIGIILIISAAVALFALVLSLISIGSISNVHPIWMDYVNAVNTVGLPIWLGIIILFFLVAVPLFFILYLGLKILINNLKSIGRVAKFSLLGIWLLALFSLIFIGINQASYYTIANSVSNDEELNITSSDTLSIKMSSGNYYKYEWQDQWNGDFKITYNEQDEKTIFSRAVYVSIKSTTDSIGHIEVVKESRGRDFLTARKSAERIEYDYKIANNELTLNNYLLTAFKNKFLDQNVRIYVYVPEGTVVKLDRNMRSYLNNRSNSGNLTSFSSGGHTVQILSNQAKCLDCDEEVDYYDDDIEIIEEESDLTREDEMENPRIEEDEERQNMDSINIDSQSDGKLQVDENGVEIVSDDN